MPSASLRDVLGRTLVWHATDDPPGGWVLALEDEPVAELAWSIEERLVRADVGDGVWRLAFEGVLSMRATLFDSARQPQLAWVGSLRRGTARTREGRDFVFFSQLDRHVGPWMGVDDASGEAVLRIRGRIGASGTWSEVTVTPDPRYRSLAGPLLLTWGGLQVLRRRRPWLGLMGAAWR